MSLLVKSVQQCCCTDEREAASRQTSGPAGSAMDSESADLAGAEPSYMEGTSMNNQDMPGDDGDMFPDQIGDDDGDDGHEEAAGPYDQGLP